MSLQVASQVVCSDKEATREESEVLSAQGFWIPYPLERCWKVHGREAVTCLCFTSLQENAVDTDSGCLARLSPEKGASYREDPRAKENPPEQRIHKYIKSSGILQLRGSGLIE